MTPSSLVEILIGEDDVDSSAQPAPGCPWCTKEFSLPPPDPNASITHGICPRHRQQMLSSMKVNPKYAAKPRARVA